MENKDRLFGLDVVKAMAILGVVALHVFGPFFIHSSVDYDISQKIIFRIFYYIATPAIPLFFLTNGYLILRKKRLPYKYILKKIWMLLVPVLAWNFLIWLVKLLATRHLVSYQGVVFKSLIQQGFFFQFWFIGALSIMLCLAPIFSKVLHTQKKLYLFLTIVMIIFCLLIDIFNHYYGFALQDNVVQTFRIWTWLTYYMIGGIFSDNNIIFFDRSHSKLKWLAIIVTALSLIYWIYNVQWIKNLYAEYNYDSILCIITSTIIFAAMLPVKSLNEKIDPIVTEISECSMGIFIIHVIVVKLLEKIDFNIFFGGCTLFSGVLFFLIVFLLSWLVTRLLLKSSFASKILV